MNQTMILFVQISIGRMTEHYLPKFAAAIGILDQATLWKHEVQWMNSIGGIVLHIGEHLNRHIVRYSGNGTVSGGIEHYFPDLDITPNELNDRIRDIFTRWESTMNTYITGQNDVALLDMHDIYHLVEHTGYHLGQIIDRTQRLTQNSFQFVQNGINEKNLRERLGDCKSGG